MRHACRDRDRRQVERGDRPAHIALGAADRNRHGPAQDERVFAGALFPITAMPRGLAGFARVLPATHALALMRYGLLGGNSSGLHDIWGMHNATAMAALSLGVVAVFAAGLTFAAMRTFRRTAVS